MSTLATNTFQELATGDSVGAKYVVHGTAKAWANLNGTGTIALRNSLNVSSVVDNGAGDYSFNFSNAMTTGSYSLSGSATRFATGASAPRIMAPFDVATQIAGSSRVRIGDDLGLVDDAALVSHIVYGDLA
jgi:hypothetical protein